MGEYKGMRWLKCDLQMQTPADGGHWQGEPIGDNAEEAAKAFADACKETGLDVIGITDHNFLSKDFIPLVVNAFKDIEQETGHRTVVFPGFEFEAAGVGKGVHVLCLFEPSSDLNALDAIITECGIGYPRVQNGQLVKSDKNLKDILKTVQDQHGGVVILPHAMSDDGIFDNAAISEWLQQDQFTNPELLAVEVPKPVHRMNENWQKLFRSGQDCQPEWKRIRPIATVMSSDNKKLIDHTDEDRPKANSIGYRYSWIKMSDPSIESLRQAFLDHESRIILPEDVVGDISPNERQRHPRVESITIKNAAFLADQEIYLSPNLNCVIGGRGSGKSTLLEYLRILLGKESESDIDRSTRDRINRIRGTLSSGNPEISVAWKSGDGVEDEIVWADGG
ncbi:MAG: AAA family ATPase, partial [Sedimenticola sp.]